MTQSKINVLQQATSVAAALERVAPVASSQAYIDEAKAAAAEVVTASRETEAARVAEKAARDRFGAATVTLQGSFRALRTVSAVTFDAWDRPFHAVAGPRPSAVGRASRARRMLLLDELLPALASTAATPVMKAVVADAERALADAKVAQSALRSATTTLNDARYREAHVIAAWQVSYRRLRHAAALAWGESPGTVGFVLATPARRSRRARGVDVAPAPDGQPDEPAPVAPVPAE